MLEEAHRLPFYVNKFKIYKCKCKYKEWRQCCSIAVRSYKMCASNTIETHWINGIRFVAYYRFFSALKPKKHTHTHTPSPITIIFSVKYNHEQTESISFFFSYSVSVFFFFISSLYHHLLLFFLFYYCIWFAKGESLCLCSTSWHW